MATLIEPARTIVREDRFFLYSALAMAAILVAGFSTHLAMGRSSFASPPLVHAHALVFFGWVTLYVTQAALATSGSIALHRRLGWVGAGWAVAMVAIGLAVITSVIQRGTTPFFFQPQHFLIANPMTLLVFAGLTTAAIVNRRRTDWHRRLHFCAMAILLGPGIGRLLPMPLLMPFGFQIAVAAGLILPAIGMVRDARKTGHVHPAWWWGTGAIVAAMLLAEVIVYSPIGDAIYAAVTAGTPGATVDPFAFAPPPGSPLITGRSPAI